MTTSRRSFLIGAAASLIVAPSVVRASSIMKVRPVSIFTMHYYQMHHPMLIGDIIESGKCEYLTDGTSRTIITYRYWDGEHFQPCIGGRIPDEALADIVARRTA